MKITLGNLRRELAELDGYTAKREDDALGWYVIVNSKGGQVSPAGYSFELESNAWDACNIPDYPNSLDACFALIVKKCYWYKLQWVPGPNRETEHNANVENGRNCQHTNPATALALAILSAHRGERVELEGNDGP